MQIRISMHHLNVIAPAERVHFTIKQECSRLTFFSIKFIYSLKPHLTWYIWYIKWKYNWIETRSEVKVYAINTHTKNKKKVGFSPRIFKNTWCVTPVVCKDDDGWCVGNRLIEVNDVKKQQCLSLLSSYPEESTHNMANVIRIIRIITCLLFVNGKNFFSFATKKIIIFWYIEIMRN